MEKFGKGGMLCCGSGMLFILISHLLGFDVHDIYPAVTGIVVALILIKIGHITP